jgi:hypothetical protein
MKPGGGAPGEVAGAARGLSDPPAAPPGRVAPLGDTAPGAGGGPGSGSRGAVGVAVGAAGAVKTAVGRSGEAGIGAGRTGPGGGKLAVQSTVPETNSVLPGPRAYASMLLPEVSCCSLRAHSCTGIHDS